MEGSGHRPEAILIAGPTASGKSSLALDLAERLGGLVINADSMQVYRDLRILTARPCAADERRVPHALYGHVDAAEGYSVSRWLLDVADALARARHDGLVPVLVGGTGLYFKALTSGLSDVPAVPCEIRADLRAWAAERTAGDLYAELMRRDPATASRLRPTDPQRILRALEVHAATGESLASFQTARAAPLLRSSPARKAVVLTLDRTVLRERIDRRFDRMMEDGALAEVHRLATRDLDPDLPAMRALGVPHLLQHMRGERDLASAIAEAKAASRRYIKRQDTFARHQLKDFVPLAPEDAALYLRGQSA